MQVRDEAAMRAALASPVTSRVMADVAHFTDATPEQSLAGPMWGGPVSKLDQVRWSHHPATS